MHVLNTNLSNMTQPIPFLHGISFTWEPQMFCYSYRERLCFQAHAN